MNALCDEGFKVHLDTGFGGVPTSLVAKVFGVEVGTEIAIEACEDVEIEGGCGAGGVIVGSEEGGFGFVCVGTAIRA